MSLLKIPPTSILLTVVIQVLATLVILMEVLVTLLVTHMETPLATPTAIQVTEAGILTVAIKHMLLPIIDLANAFKVSFDTKEDVFRNNGVLILVSLKNGIIFKVNF
jgi:hypothetical protein